MLLTNVRKSLIVAALLLGVAACGGDDGADGPAATTAGPDATFSVDEPLDNVAGLSDACTAVSNLSFALTGAVSGDNANVEDFIAAAKSQSPSSIHGDIDIMGEAIRQIDAFYDKIGGNPLTDPNIIQSLSEDDLAEFDQIFDNDEADAAFDRLSEWAEAECAQVGG